MYIDGNRTLCPCGSHKKYQDCCFVTPAIDAKDKLKTIEKFGDKITTKIAKFAQQYIDPTVMNVAWQPFMCWSEFSFEDDAYDIPESAQMFTFYQLYRWRHIEPFHQAAKYRSLQNTPARYYLSRRPMDIQERDYIQAMLNSNYCYYQIIKVVENHHMLLKNLFTDEEVAVLEHIASRPENVGDVIFTAIVEHRNIRFMVGTGCYLFSTYALNTLADFRYSVEEPWQDVDVEDHQPELLDLYWGLRDELFNPHDNFEEEFEIPTHKGPLGPLTLLENGCSKEQNPSNVTQLYKQHHENSDSQENVHSIVGQIEMQYLHKWLNQKHPMLNNLSPKQAAEKSQLKNELIKLASQLEYSNPFHRKWLLNQLDL